MKKYNYKMEYNICFLYLEGFTNKEISEILNINRHTITSILKQNNIYVYPQNKKNNIYSKKERNNQIINLYKSGKSFEQISKKMNISTSTIKNVLVSYNIPIKTEQYYNKYTYDRSIFKVIDSEEKAYWLGFLYADGYVGDNGTIELALSEKDLDHIKKFKLFMNSNHKIKHDKKTKSYRILICSIELKNDLIVLGCVPRKSLILKFPTEEQVPKHLTHHFMRGYFDGDGCIAIKQNQFSVLGTSEFLDKYEYNLLLGINRKKPNKRIHRNTWNENTECIMYSGTNQIPKIYNYLYKDANIYLQRKYEKFNMLLPSQNEADNNFETINAELSGKAVKSKDTQPEPKANSNISQGQSIEDDPLSDE